VKLSEKTVPVRQEEGQAWFFYLSSGYSADSSSAVDGRKICCEHCTKSRRKRRFKV